MVISSPLKLLNDTSQFVGLVFSITYHSDEYFLFLQHDTFWDNMD